MSEIIRRMQELEAVIAEQDAATSTKKEELRKLRFGVREHLLKFFASSPIGFAPADARVVTDQVMQDLQGLVKAVTDAGLVP